MGFVSPHITGTCDGQNSKWSSATAGVIENNVIASPDNIAIIFLDLIFIVALLQR
jgi:hypothetical protein